MSKTYKLLFLIIVSLGFAGIGTFAYLYLKPVKDISEQKIDIQSTDNDLLKEFTTNDLKADTKYKNKILKLSGALKKIEIKESICNIIFDNGGNFIIVANCDYVLKNEIQKLTVGNKITIKGIYAGFVILDETFMIPAEIKLDKCILVE